MAPAGWAGGGDDKEADLICVLLFLSSFESLVDALMFPVCVWGGGKRKERRRRTFSHDYSILSSHVECRAGHRARARSSVAANSHQRESPTSYSFPFFSIYYTTTSYMKKRGRLQERGCDAPHLPSSVRLQLL